MANRNDKVEGNVAGAFYVDNTCIDCDLCRSTAPESFRRDEARSFSLVYQQPVSAEQIRLATEAMLGCPHDCIGNDG